MMATAELQEIAGGDETLLAELMRDLSEALRTSLELLREATSDEDWALRAHRLKGGALTLGSPKLASLAARAESEGRRSELLLAEIEATFAREISR